MDAGHDDEKTADAILDLMDLELGESSGKQDASARSKFNGFLTRIEHGRDFENLRKKDITVDLIGKFCSFLLQDDISWQTSMNYLSSIKRQLETGTRTELFKKESDWYKRCRRNLHQQCVLQAIKSGKRLKDQAAMMALDDLEELCRILFMQSTASALMDRTLLNNQWLTIGRSSDIGNLLYDDLHWLDRYLIIDLTRLVPHVMVLYRAKTDTTASCSLKVRQQHSISIFCSPGKWAIDPFHALASQLVADPYNASDRVFSQISDGKSESRIAAHINRVLKSLYQSDVSAVLTPRLQSHSARRGGAAHASSHGDVKLSDLAHRGLWSMDGFATLLEYISPTSASDQTIAKVLGGWNDPSRAGSPPSLACFNAHHHEAKARVTEFSEIMRRQYFSKIAKQSFADCLTATLLMYYDETLTAAPNHVVHTNMDAATREMRTRRATQNELKEWGRFIRKHFVLDNLLALPVQYVKNNMSDRELSERYVGIHTFSEALERGITGYREVMTELQDVKSMLHRIMDSVHELRVSSAGTCLCHQQHRENYSDSPPTVDAVSVSSPSSAPIENAGITQFLLGRPWPQDFTTVRNMLLQDLLVRYVREGLAFAKYAPDNRVQKEVHRAIQIIKEFVEMASLPSGYAHSTTALTLTHNHDLAGFARQVQKAVIDFIESKRAQLEARKRSRSLTGMVSGVVRAWDMLDAQSRESTALLVKLRFQPSTQ